MKKTVWKLSVPGYVLDDIENYMFDDKNNAEKALNTILDYYCIPECERHAYHVYQYIIDDDAMMMHVQDIFDTRGRYAHITFNTQKKSIKVRIYDPTYYEFSEPEMETHVGFGGIATTVYHVPFRSDISEAVKIAADFAQKDVKNCNIGNIDEYTVEIE